MKVQTGQGTIPLITLIGIFSISALNALPGLAVSPILGDLNKIFPSATDLEIQMLSSLPSLLIIPFILLSGKLTYYLSTKSVKNKLLYIPYYFLFMNINVIKGFFYFIRKNKNDGTWEKVRRAV